MTTAACATRVSAPAGLCSARKTTRSSPPTTPFIGKAAATWRLSATRNYLAKDSYKVFHTRMVRPGVTNGDYTEIIAGLLPGEVVVTKGSGVLRAELLKGNLGAG